MLLEEIAPSPDGRPGGWAMSEWADVDELLAFRAEQRAAAPGQQLLFVLDDHQQAAYTSMHCVQRHGLDVPDIDRLPAAEREAYESELVLTPLRWAETVVAGVRRLADAGDLVEFEGRLIAPHKAGGEIVETCGEPVAVFGSVARCHSVVAAAPSDAIAAHPNGYFDGDLDPGAVWLLAQLLRERFGLELLGLGAALIAFVRSEPLDRADARQVIGALRPLYRPAPEDVWERWVDAAVGRSWFVASYRGD